MGVLRTVRVAFSRCRIRTNTHGKSWRGCVLQQGHPPEVGQEVLALLLVAAEVCAGREHGLPHMGNTRVYNLLRRSKLTCHSLVWKYPKLLYNVSAKQTAQLNWIRNLVNLDRLITHVE